MDLTQIRNRVMRLTGNYNVDDIDAEINMVQRQYIQPVARQPNLAVLGEDEGEVLEPEIPEQWHDLYWLGAVAMLMPDKYYPIFISRLREFRIDRTRAAYPDGVQLSPKRGRW